MQNSVPELLQDKIKIYIEKNKEYGDTSEIFGHLCDVLFPCGLKIAGSDDFNKWGIYHMLLHKMLRISCNLFSGKAPVDSIKDIQVYAAMLERLFVKEN